MPESYWEFGMTSYFYKTLQTIYLSMKCLAKKNWQNIKCFAKRLAAVFTLEGASINYLLNKGGISHDSFNIKYSEDYCGHKVMCESVWYRSLGINLLWFYSTDMLEESQDGMDSGTLSPPSARQVTIKRHPTQGFGFIAGSQRPVIVRSVSAG